MIEIRRATPSDIDAISALASSLETDLKGMLSTEQIDYLHDLSYVQGNIKNQFDEGQLFFVAAANGKDVGFATLFAEGLTRRVEEEPLITLIRRQIPTLDAPELEGRTVIVAAHRPSVFALCSRVYKIEDHRMSEVDEKGLMDFLDRF